MAKASLTETLQKTKTNQTFFCPLFDHYKQVEVCTFLRAKRVCRFQCEQYFKWANQNKEHIQTSIPLIQERVLEHLHHRGDFKHDDLMKNIMPAGDFICDYCGKATTTERKLQLHLKRKHKRLLELRSK